MPSAFVRGDIQTPFLSVLFCQPMISIVDEAKADTCNCNDVFSQPTFRGLFFVRSSARKPSALKPFASLGVTGLRVLVDPEPPNFTP